MTKQYIHLFLQVLMQLLSALTQQLLSMFSCSFLVLPK